MPLKLEFSFEDPNYNPTSDNGTLTISSQCGSCATLWDASLGGAQISLPMSASGANLPRNLSYTAYVQGKPETYGNGLFTLSFWGGGCSGSDSCKITVSRLDIATSLSNNPFSPLSDPEYVPGTPNEDDPGIFIPKGGSRYMQILYRHGEDPVPAPLPGDVARFEALAPPAHVSLMWLNPPQPPPQPFPLPWLPPMNSLPSNGVCQATFEVTGESVGVDTIRWRMPVPNASPVEDTVKLTVVDLDNLEWEKYTVPNLPPGAQQNPALMQMYDASVGMFPDQFPEDPVAVTERQKVWVKATITPAVPGVTVYFRLFDVDDPSSSLVIDTNGAVGEDNTGLKSVWLASAVTDASGVARTVSSVSLYPGDNWRAVASCIYGALEVADAIQVEYGPTPAGCKVSKKLTVWRRLWREFDSMAAPLATGTYSQTNYQQMTVDGITYSNGNTILEVDGHLTGDENQFRLGHVTFSNASVYPIMSNTDNLLYDDTLLLNGLVPLNLVGAAAKIYDDDWVVPASPLTGPETLKRPIPYALSGGDLMFQSFGKAYVYVTPVPSNYVQTTIPFEAHKLASPAGKDLANSSSFWYARMLAAWQAEEGGDDSDPEKPGTTLGITQWTPLGDYGNIFVEAIREEEYEAYPRERERVVITHEIGHTRGLLDENSGGYVMQFDSPPGASGFSDSDIRHIREHIVPEKELEE